MSTSAPEGTSQNEHILPLPNNRQLHYASAGNPASTVVILFFSGYFSVGSATTSSLPKALGEAHYIAPTIPGNGLTSSTSKGVPYHNNLCEYITALLDELHPADGSKGNAITQLWIGGGSYGTGPAQMLFGAPYAQFAYGARISGMLVAAPFSPFKQHKEYTKSLTWPDWWLPFRLVQRLLSTFMASRLKDLKGARSLLDMALFSKMDEPERRHLEAFARSNRGMSAEDFKKEMSESVLKCVVNWDGFLEGPDVLHSDWGFEPSQLDVDHRKAVLVVLSNSDDLGAGMGKWLVENYHKAVLKKFDGGHIAALYHWQELWTDLVHQAGHDNPDRGS
ncbi:uncharacterized protein LTR77_007022 [Saxophila tyrrhenica]|uniref:AB hydrolase-1 domain-containing protein n=1 Tax=Saxophila tyrrhenica TaxID=1690608 RepID=A0AAV9P6M8_9PEZI|nr:hypothetical protein LTR77_007022 [Saxophila tyrrhenica]